MDTKQIKEFMSRAEILLREIEEKKQEMADLKKEMKDTGINVKAALNVIKIKLANKEKEAGEYIADVTMYADCAGVQLGLIFSEENKYSTESAKKSKKDAKAISSKLSIAETEEEDIAPPFDEKTMAINAQLTDIPESLRRI